MNSHDMSSRRVASGKTTACVFTRFNAAVHCISRIIHILNVTEPTSQSLPQHGIGLRTKMTLHDGAYLVRKERGRQRKEVELDKRHTPAAVR